MGRSSSLAFLLAVATPLVPASLTSAAGLFSLAPAQAPDSAADRVEPGALVARACPSPADPGARYPRLARGADGRLRLAWTTPVAEADTVDEPLHAVSFARWDDGAFGAAQELERGPGHFVNWADAPLVSANADGVPVGGWLLANGAGPYAYGVRLLAGGEPRWLHTDEGPFEHGFLSFAPRADGGLDAVWLDGRATGGGHGADAGHAAAGGHGGAMALLTRAIAADGTLGPEHTLDARVCDCCQTDAVRLADGGLLVAYRDRGDDERRDIAFVRRGADGALSAPRDVHADHWIVTGCPVNGPALAAAGDRAACAWYTEAPFPQVQLAVSNAGATAFGAPVVVEDRGTLGRVSVAALADGTWLVSYLVETDRDDARGEWRVRRFGSREPGDDVLAPLGEALTVAAVDTTRRSGFLRLAADGDGALAAWTDVDDGYAVRVARIAVR